MAEMVTIYTLEPGSVYVVSKPFTDFYGDAFTIGERLTFVERHFLPYHGGHTVIFKERALSLQEDANADIIEAFSEFFALCE